MLWIRDVLLFVHAVPHFSDCPRRVETEFCVSLRTRDVYTIIDYGDVSKAYIYGQSQYAMQALTAESSDSNGCPEDQDIDILPWSSGEYILKAFAVSHILRKPQKRPYVTLYYYYDYPLPIARVPRLYWRRVDVSTLPSRKS